MVVRSVYKEGGKVFLIETKGQTPLFVDFQNQSPQRGKLDSLVFLHEGRKAGGS